MTQQFTNYAQLNTVTVKGRIAKSEIVQGKKGEFLSITVLTTLTTDGQTAAFNFLDSAGLMALAGKGYLPVGREITITGHISLVKETYTNKDGAIQMQKSPQLSLTNVVIPDGGLGPMPADKSAASNKVVKAPVRPMDAANYVTGGAISTFGPDPAPLLY